MDMLFALIKLAFLLQLSDNNLEYNRIDIPLNGVKLRIPAVGQPGDVVHYGLINVVNGFDIHAQMVFQKLLVAGPGYGGSGFKRI